MILPFEMGFISKTTQQRDFYTGNGVTLLHSPIPEGFGSVAFTLCSNCQIHIESISQNDLL